MQNIPIETRRKEGTETKWRGGTKSRDWTKEREETEEKDDKRNEKDKTEIEKEDEDKADDKEEQYRRIKKILLQKRARQEWALQRKINNKEKIQIKSKEKKQE